MNKICTIYRSPKKDGMYLYVEKVEDLKRVPEKLLKKFGKPAFAMTLVITPDKKLARVDARTVLAALSDLGYFLQIPPQYESAITELNLKNSKISL
ncbi:MAG: hypothetical protein ACI92E_002158 [Oceanicoccus sp.]|jgi:uncharacterized protein YcgL (UPF0745 family)